MSSVKVEGDRYLNHLSDAVLFPSVNYRPFSSTEEQSSDNKPILSGNIPLLINLVPSSFNQKHQVHHLLFLH